MKVKRAELVNILSIVKPGLAKKNIVEQMTQFILTGKDIVTYNDKICVAYPFNTDFNCSVSADEFYKILNGISVDEIDLSLVEDKLRIKAKGINSGLVTDTGKEVLAKVDLLDIDAMAKESLLLPEDFIEGVNLCMFSASKDQTNLALTCLFIEDGYIASTDDLRISEYLMKTDMKCSILVPAAAIIELVKFKVTKYALGGSWIYFFADEGLVFCSRLIDATFPKYEEFLEGFDTTEIKLPKELVSMIATASIVAEGEIDQDKEINIEILDGKLKVLGSNKIGWIESETELTFKSKDKIKFTINPIFLAKVLTHTQSMFFGGNKVLFRSGEFRHVIALKVDE